jgi:hypothetical protein
VFAAFNIALMMEAASIYETGATPQETVVVKFHSEVNILYSIT